MNQTDIADSEILHVSGFVLGEYYMTPLKKIAACAVQLNDTELFNNAKIAHDRIIRVYKKASINSSLYSTQAMIYGCGYYLEEDHTFKSILNHAKTQSPQELVKIVKEQMEKVNKAKRLYEGVL